MPGERHRFGRAIGRVAASAAGTLLFLALFIAGCQTTGGADRLGEDDFGAIKPTSTPTIVDTPLDDTGDLAWTFAPVLHLQHDEQYPPTGVEYFLRGSSQSGAKPIGPASELTLATLPVECPDGGHDACGTISCPECAARTKETQPEGFVPQGTFYARVAHRASTPRVFSGWNYFGDRLVTLIQYWIFYGYDRWQTETVIGRLTQEHEGDWEHVSVGLDQQDKPLFVALSAHCGGQVVGWDRIAAAPGRLVDGKIVISAERASADEEGDPSDRRRCQGITRELRRLRRAPPTRLGQLQEPARRRPVRAQLRLECPRPDRGRQQRLVRLSGRCAAGHRSDAADDLPGLLGHGGVHHLRSSETGPHGARAALAAAPDQKLGQADRRLLLR
jgi:hypothetical protein